MNKVKTAKSLNFKKGTLKQKYKKVFENRAINSCKEDFQIYFE